MDKLKVILAVAYFIALYITAFVSNRDYREKDDFLFISVRQWKAIFVMCVPLLFLFVGGDGIE